MRMLLTKYCVNLQAYQQKGQEFLQRKWIEQTLVNEYGFPGRRNIE